MITWMKKANNFKIAKVQPQGVASFCLTFWQFQYSVAYKSGAYKTDYRVISRCNPFDVRLMMMTQRN